MCPKQNLTQEEIEDYEAFLYGAAHHVRKTFSLLCGFTEFLNESRASLPEEETDRLLNLMQHLAWQVNEQLDAPLLYFNLLRHIDITWQAVALDRVVEWAIQSIAPYEEPEGSLEIHLPEDVPTIKGDGHWLPRALGGLLYKGRRGSVTLAFAAASADVLVGHVRTDHVDPRVKAISELFLPGRRSGQRLAMSKRIFALYGSPLTCRLAGEGYEFEFHLFTA